MTDGVWATVLSDWRAMTLLLAIAVLLLVAFGFVISASALRMRNIRKAQRWGRLESKWETTVAAVLAGQAGRSDLIDQVSRGEELYFVDFLYRQARVRPQEERELLGELARPYLAPIVDRIHQGDPERRARAVQTVSVLAFKQYGDNVLGALDDPSPLVAMIAARALARIREPRYVAAVIERLDRFQDASPRFLTAMLVSMGEVAVPALREGLASPLHTPQVRAVCADALRQLNDAESVDTAVQVLGVETDSDVVAACLRLLRRLGSPEHVPAIRPLTASPDFAIRAQAVGAIGRLGGARDSEVLQRALDDPSPWVALSAARALRDRGQTHLLRNLAASQHEHTDIALQVLTE